MILYRKAQTGAPVSRTVDTIQYGKSIGTTTPGSSIPSGQLNSSGQQRYHNGYELIDNNVMRDTAGTVMEVKPGQQMPNGWSWDDKGNIMKSYKPGTTLPTGGVAKRLTHLQAWRPTEKVQSDAMASATPAVPGVPQAPTSPSTPKVSGMTRANASQAASAPVASRSYGRIASNPMTF